VDRGEPVRLRVRQRFEQQAVDHREDGGIDAAADCQRDERDRREPRRLAQHAEPVTEIAPQHLEHGQAVHLVYLLADRRRIPEAAPCLPDGALARVAAGDQVVYVMIEVRLHLARAFGVEAAAAEESKHVSPRSAALLARWRGPAASTARSRVRAAAALSA